MLLVPFVVSSSCFPVHSHLLPPEGDTEKNIEAILVRAQTLVGTNGPPECFGGPTRVTQFRLQAHEPVFEGQTASKQESSDPIPLQLRWTSVYENGIVLITGGGPGGPGVVFSCKMKPCV